MINQVTRDRINGLSEEYRKLAVKYKEAIKELTISELPEMVYNSNAIENSTLTLEDTEDILIRNQIRSDHEVREIYEAKNLASAIESLMDNSEKEISVELILKLHKTLLTNIRDTKPYLQIFATRSLVVFVLVKNGYASVRTLVPIQNL